MIGNASERLKTDDIVNTRVRQMAYFARKEPAFAEIGCEIDDVGSKAGIVEYVGKRAIERIRTADGIVTTHSAQYVMMKRIGYEARGSGYCFNVLFAIDMSIDKSSAEKTY